MYSRLPVLCAFCLGRLYYETDLKKEIPKMNVSNKAIIQLG